MTDGVKFDELWAAIGPGDGRPEPGLDLRGRAVDIEGAYGLQDLLVARLGPTCGVKIAANSPPLLKAFGIDEPLAGHIVGANPRAPQVAWHDFRELVVEPEFVAVLGRDVEAPVADVRDVIDYFVPGFEVLERRGLSTPHGPTAVAHNVFNAGVVVGDGRMTLDAARAASVRFIQNGRVLGEGTGTAPQDPGDAVAFLVGHVMSRGGQLRRGDYLLCGTHYPPIAVTEALNFTFETGGGAAHLTVTG
ncbi:MAG: hypothetical protein AAF761_11800 [Pseudomonadota bacterium]